MTTASDVDELQHGLYIDNTPANLDDLATPSNAVDYAVAAEDAGWDGVFMADEFAGSGSTRFDPWITHASIAAVTDRIRLGSWVTPLPRRQPWQVANELAVLDDLSDGRVIFGAGLGAPWNYESTGMGYRPTALGDRFDEALDVIADLWDGDPVTYDGDHFTIEDMQLSNTPVQEPRIPIMMGSWWPNEKPLHRAAEWDGIMPAAPSFYGGDGVQGEPVTGTVEEELAALLAYYREDAGGSGDVLIPIDVPEAPPDFLDVCRDLGVTWTLTTDLLDSDSHDANLERIRAGPPAGNPRTGGL